MSKALSRVADMIVEIREQSHEIVGNREEIQTCDICGDAEYYVDEEDAETTIEHYAVGCWKRGCDGVLSFTLVQAETKGTIPLFRREFLDVECRGCQVENPPLQDIVAESDPFEVEDSFIPIEQILTVNIHQHHTSYEPEEIIPLCSKCHGKVHKTEGFFDDLKPEMARKEWVGDD